MTDEKNDETTSDGVPVSNIGYAAVPEGFVFVPTEGGTGERELLKKLFDAVENPEDVITRPGYGYLIPESAAGGFETVDVVTVVDESTPDSTPAASALDTQEDAGVQDNVGDTADGPLPEGATTESVEDDTPAAAPAVNTQAVDPSPAPSDPAPDNSQTPVVTDTPSGDVPTVSPSDASAPVDAASTDAPATDTDTAASTSSSSKKGSAASAAS